ncbi:hypothetical protein Fmac_006421 [Flemingia macrophylla]|uniref:Uncharacterized protein n=1 Tax=Flemingia macrophylla TaxID=520843 RepID=A0ABD1NB45_9FABA
MEALPSPQYNHFFFAASKMLKEPLEKWLSEMETLPACIVSDICLPWTSTVRSKFNIPRVVFHGISHSWCRPSLTQLNSPRHSYLWQRIRNKTWKHAIDQFKAAELSAEGILVNTFEELEKMYVREYEKVVRKIWCIGPLSLHDKLILDRLGREDKENKSSMDELKDVLIFFLPKSLVLWYMSVSAACLALGLHRWKELALGLEESSHPFIWVIGKNDCCEEIQKWLEVESFEERNRGRGVIYS